MNYSIRRQIVILVGLLYVQYIGASVLEMKSGYATDNLGFLLCEMVMSQRAISMPFADLMWQVSYEQPQETNNSWVFDKFEKNFIEAEFGIARRIGILALKGKFGVRDSLRGFGSIDNKMFTGGSTIGIDYKYGASKDNGISASIDYKRKIADLNPMILAMGIRCDALRADIGIQLKQWEMKGEYRISKYATVKKEQYYAFLNDTAAFSEVHESLVFLNENMPERVDAVTEVDPIPRNTIEKWSAYGYGPLFPFLYIGVFGEYEHAAKNYMIPIGTLNADSGFEYGYFPYFTPHHAYAAGLTLAVVYYPENAKFPVTGVSGKVTFPVVSSGIFSGYYEETPGNLIGLTDFNYRYGGTEPLVTEVEAYKELGKQFTVKVNYIYHVKPYYSYGFFKDEAYRYHNVNVSLAWAFK